MRTVGWVTVSATILISGYAVAALGAEGKEPEGKLVFLFNIEYGGYESGNGQFQTAVSQSGRAV